MNNKKRGYNLMQYGLAWGVHVFTASAAYVGILTLVNIHQQNYVMALWLMGITVLIDAVDGSLARLVHVKSVLPKMDGALLDNIVDYLNYVITPCFFLLSKPDMLPAAYTVWITVAITITSTYQFCQADAKTPDHFFKGFPCYWNFAVFYMFIFNTSAITNAWILAIFCVFIFIPIKYVYPSRIDYLTTSTRLKLVMHSCSVLYGLSSSLLLWYYPQHNPLWLGVSLGYVMMYLFLSFYRTYSPIKRSCDL